MRRQIWLSRTGCAIRSCSLPTRPMETRSPDGEHAPVVHQSLAEMYQGKVNQPLLTFDLSGQANGKKPYWAWDYRNLAPRFAVAYSPHASSGFLHTLFGDTGKSSIRAGYGLYFDHFGEGVVNTFDRQGSWGLTTTISNPAGVLSVDTSPRYTGLLGASNLPPSPGVPPPHGFPYQPSIDPNTYGLAIAWGIDDNLKTPYSTWWTFRSLANCRTISSWKPPTRDASPITCCRKSISLSLSTWSIRPAKQIISRRLRCSRRRPMPESPKAPWRRFPTGNIFPQAAGAGNYWRCSRHASRSHGHPKYL